MVTKIKSYIKKALDIGVVKLSPEKGYNLWAEGYEDKTNLMQYLDCQLVEEGLSKIDLRNKVILDFGCGTGRHWPRLLDQKPKELIGCDISESMLKELLKRMPDAKIHFMTDQKLTFQPDHCVDCIFSTLTIGHIPDLQMVGEEWTRIATSNARLIFTGNHPQALTLGVNRSFRVNNKTYNIANNIHSLDHIRRCLGALGWREIRMIEIPISEDHKEWFEHHNALKSYQQIFGIPVIFLMHWEKK